LLSINKRPRHFVDVLGQDRNVLAFRNHAKNDTFPQVMMLSGVTGTGKTTSAGIISSVINCHNPIVTDGYLEPCLTCDSCLDIINESYDRDIKFYDASRMGKDNVLALEAEANRQPMFEDNKIIIIEEAQELSSKGARGALLKLIEKPRKHVYFILITMNENKFEKAIKDRCQIYKFNKVRANIIEDYLFKLITEIDPDEKIPTTVFDVLHLIATNSEGSLRKALQDFQRCLDSEIYNKDDALEVLNYLSEEDMHKMILFLLSGDYKLFFDNLEKYEIYEFYRYTWKILTSVRQTDITNFYIAKWVEDRAKSIKAYSDYTNLLKVYNDIYATGYFSDNVFKFNIYQFIEGRQKIKKALPVIEPSKKRRKKVVK